MVVSTALHESILGQGLVHYRDGKEEVRKQGSKEEGEKGGSGRSGGRKRYV